MTGAWWLVNPAQEAESIGMRRVSTSDEALVYCRDRMRELAQSVGGYGAPVATAKLDGGLTVEVVFNPREFGFERDLAGIEANFLHELSLEIGAGLPGVLDG